MIETNEIPIHPKEWGAEHWIVNREYCGKKLVLKKGYRCSIHHHKIKDETFYVIKGRVLIEINGQQRVLTPGDKQHIAAGESHRFTGLEPSEMIEFSTHHRGDDSYRDVPSGKVPEEEFRQLLALADRTAEP
jgi:mannose-6-phosphate isomerase-like protein (cupin superfamily)